MQQVLALKVVSFLGYHFSSITPLTNGLVNCSQGNLFLLGGKNLKCQISSLLLAKYNSRVYVSRLISNIWFSPLLAELSTHWKPMNHHTVKFKGSKSISLLSKGIQLEDVNTNGVEGLITYMWMRTSYINQDLLILSQSLDSWTGVIDKPGYVYYVY